MTHIAKVIEIIGSSDKGWEPGGGEDKGCSSSNKRSEKDVAWNTWNRSYGYDCNSR